MTVSQHGDATVRAPAPSTETTASQLPQSILRRVKEIQRAQGFNPRRSKSRPPGPSTKKDATRGEWSGPSTDERDPDLVGNSVRELIRHNDWREQISVASITAKWATIVGEEVAKHCQPLAFDDNTLIVQPSSTAWATQLRILAPAVIRRIADEIGSGIVVELQIVGPNNMSFKRGPKSVRGRGPRDTWG